MKNLLFERLNNGEFIKVTIKKGTIGCSDVQELFHKNGYVVIYKKNDNYRIDDNDENILCVDDFNYVNMIVDKILN